jgi:isocitrate/isopropylmalate dehydrogenase
VRESSNGSSSARYRIAVIPGDGIGGEFIPAGLEIAAVAQREAGGMVDQFG